MAYSRLKQTQKHCSKSAPNATCKQGSKQPKRMAANFLVPQVLKPTSLTDKQIFLPVQASTTPWGLWARH